MNQIAILKQLVIHKNHIQINKIDQVKLSKGQNKVIFGKKKKRTKHRLKLFHSPFSGFHLTFGLPDVARPFAQCGEAQARYSERRR